MLNFVSRSPSLLVGIISILLGGGLWKYLLDANRNAVAEYLTGLGAVSHEKARLWFLQPLVPCVANKTKPKIYLRVNDGTDQEWLALRNVVIDPWFAMERSCTSAATIDGLYPNTAYQYRTVWDRNGASHVEHVGSFSTFPIPGTASQFRFAFSSCLQV